jgi:uncharacterized membrane protein (UPF0182 family)
VLRGQTLVLPIDNTFLFVAPIYIQAAQARMPQLEKVVLAAGSRLAYADTYQKALADLEATQRGMPKPVETSSSPPTSAEAPSAKPPVSQTSPGTDPRIPEIRGHLDRYRSLASQGKWAEAGKELDAVQELVNRR